MYIFVGIDPSINSTGIVVQYYDESYVKTKEHFYIIKPDKLSKKEQKANDMYLFFDYVLYDRYDLKQCENNHCHELYKTLNMIKVVEHIKEIVSKLTQNNDNVYVVQEGISYGSSIRTKSVFDLAGLNYMIRYVLNKFKCVNVIIATPSEIKKWVTGSGNCNKEIIIDMFKSLYPDFDIPKLDDISDAYFMSLYAKKIFEDNMNNE